MTRHPPFLSGTIWPVHPLPQPDELLSSFIVRVAREHSARPTAFWKAVAGVSRLLEVDFEPPPDLIPVLVERVGISVERIQQMTIGCFAKFGLLRDEDSRIIAFCPECLKSELPYYRRSWCLQFYTVCAEHHAAVRTKCGQCRAWIRFERLSLEKALTTCHKCGLDLCPASGGSSASVNQLDTLIGHQNRLERLLDRNNGFQ